MITTQKNTRKWNADYLADDETGKVIYGYVMDSCPDENFWCRRDDYHLDISEPYLESLGYVGAIWNGRKISWDFLSATPGGCGFSFSRPLSL